MGQPIIIPKPLGLRLQELMRGLLVLRDSVDAVRAGRPHQLLPIYGQLRALLAEKSKGNPPLLVDLAAVLGQKVEVWAFTGVDQDSFPQLSVEPLLRVGGLPVSVYQTNPHQKLISLETFLDQKMLLLHGRYFSRRELIKLFAEKAGGAHFAEKVPKEFAEMNALEVSGLPALSNAMLQIGCATLEVGARLLQELCGFSLHFEMAVPKTTKPNAGVVYDSVYPETSMRYWLGLTPFGQARFGAIGLDGFRAELTAERLIDWSQPRHLSIHHSISKRLDSEMAIEVDGETFAELVVPHPIFLTRELNDYIRYHNRSQEDEKAGMTLAMMTHVAIVGARNLKERCAMLSFFEKQRKDPDATCTLYTKGSYGVANPGEREIRMTGAVKKFDWRKLLAGEWPTEESPAGHI
jgi:hypothetical protein